MRSASFFSYPQKTRFLSIGRYQDIMLLSVEDLKKHLNIDHDEDDAYIQELISVAEDAVETYINRPISEFVDAEGKVESRTC